MECVIVNADGELYAGFLDGKPHWIRTKRTECLMAEPLAETVLRQLTQLGFTDLAIRDAAGIARKWVPKDRSAAA